VVGTEFSRTGLSYGSGEYPLAGGVEIMGTRILLVDDHPVVRRGLKHLLGVQPGWEIVDEAADGVEAVEKAQRLDPDVVLLDISMPKMGGLEACRLIRETAPRCEILILTQHNSTQMLQEALNAGARGYVVKSKADSDLLQAVQAAKEHRSFVALDC
jgi:DNA-binding NarL/FixJ family response regulator